MELRKHLDYRKIFIALFCLVFVAYFVYGLSPAEAANYNLFGNIEIPAIGLASDTTKIELVDNRLSVPDEIAGDYSPNHNATFLFGHSTTVFSKLNMVKLHDEIIHNGISYRVVARDMIAKSLISMNKLLAEKEKDTLILMTCAGTLLDNGDATHRLIITAIRE